MKQSLTQQYIASIEDVRQRELLHRMNTLQACLRSVEMESVGLLLVVQVLTWMVLPCGFDVLFYILGDGLVSLALGGAFVCAAVPSVWLTGSGLPDNEVTKRRICSQSEAEDQFEEYIDMEEGGLAWLERSFRRGRSLLMGARICQFAALAGIVAAVITALCLYL